MSAEIVLVNPPLTKEQRYRELGSAGVFMPPLGLGYLASNLRKEGYKVKIIDSEALQLDIDTVTKKVLTLKPNFVGFTAVTMSIFSSAEIANELKQRNEDIYTIIGGPHISATPKKTMRLFPDFDIGVVGEGEITIVELINALQKKRDLREVKGIIYRNKTGLVKTPLRPLLENLDVLPYPTWDLFPDLKEYYKPSVFGFKKLPCSSIVTSRGCPSQCTFCNQGVWGRRYREHSVEYVMDMIKILYYEYNIRDIAIYDGTFGINKPRVVKLCKLLLKEDLDLVWSCNFRIKMAESKLLNLMKKAGCWQIAYGIESCSQNILDFIRKETNVGMIRRALKLTKRAGIMTKGYIMVGTLIESEQTIKKTLREILKLDLDLLTVNSFTPFPGTLDYERASQYGKFDKDWRKLNEHNYVFVPEKLSREELEYYRKLITRKFYLRPKILLKFAKKGFNSKYWKILLKGFVAFLKFICFKSVIKGEKN